MMKFKNTLIIFLGIIAIIFAGCKEKKATHESGALEEPKVETYEENGVNFYKRKFHKHGRFVNLLQKYFAVYCHHKANVKKASMKEETNI